MRKDWCALNTVKIIKVKWGKWQGDELEVITEENEHFLINRQHTWEEGVAVKTIVFQKPKSKDLTFFLVMPENISS